MVPRSGCGFTKNHPSHTHLYLLLLIWQVREIQEIGYMEASARAVARILTTFWCTSWINMDCREQSLGESSVGLVKRPEGQMATTVASHKALDPLLFNNLTDALG